jgi:alpha-glucosidase
MHIINALPLVGSLASADGRGRSAMSEWWRGGVIYQVYPRSFYDSDGDGVGDLPGVISRLGYLARLGIDGIWLSPFFKSPMRDFGYDISDYCAVDPIFGTLADFDRLLAATHEQRLKLIIDQVYSHTSDQHPWFKESRQSRDNAKADWYVWADARPDGGPPNNWIALFGGQAWSWDSRRRQYYMHNFLPEQPDLNFHNPDVRAAILDVARFWLGRGVDGFRLDVANFYFCDRQLRSNPAKSESGGFARPYWHQRHLYDRSQPENLEFMSELRREVDRFGELMTVAEIGSDSYIERSIEYTEPGRLHTAYNFLLLENGPLTARLIRDAVESWTSKTAWPSWSFSNHDVVRARTRWGGEAAPDGFAQLLMGVLLCLRGTIFLYQGDELGLPQAKVPFERLRDPEGIRFWPDSLGRDGCRTPIPWEAASPNAGFGDGEPWLPVDPGHVPLAVDRQEADPASTLALTRRFIAFRKAHPALRLGEIAFLDAPEPILAFRRLQEEGSLLCLFNLGASEQRFALPPGTGAALDYGLPGHIENDVAILPPWGGSVLCA